MQVNKATYTADELRLPGLRHFIFKWRSNLQSTSPRFEDPYEVNSDDQKRLICLYGIAQAHVYRRATSSTAKANTKKGGEDVVDDQVDKTIKGAEGQQGSVNGTAPPSSPILRPKNILSPALDSQPSPTSSKKKTTTTSPILAPKKKSIITGQHLIKTSSEIVFAWSTVQFELYLAAGLHLPRNAIINIAKAIVKWVKQEEHRLFIASPAVFD